VAMIRAFGPGGNIKLTSFLDEVAKRLNGEARKRTYAAANIVKRDWLHTLSGQRSGRVYNIPGGKGSYIASAPGEPPAVALGDLRRSVKAISRRSPLTGEWEALVGSDMEKAPWLEFGTGRRGAAAGQSDLPPGYSHGSSAGMAPRPSLRPALEHTRDEVHGVLGRRML